MDQHHPYVVLRRTTSTSSLSLSTLLWSLSIFAPTLCIRSAYHWDQTKNFSHSSVETTFGLVFTIVQEVWEMKHAIFFSWLELYSKFESLKIKSFFSISVFIEVIVKSVLVRNYDYIIFFIFDHTIILCFRIFS